MPPETVDETRQEAVAFNSANCLSSGSIPLLGLEWDILISNVRCTLVNQSAVGSAFCKVE